MYILQSKSEADRYLSKDNVGKFTITIRPEKATKFPDAGKAWKALSTQMSKKKRGDWKVSEYITDAEKKQSKTAFRIDLPPRAGDDETFDWEKVQKNITESFSEIIAYKEKLRLRLEAVEAELCDCEHACEFFKCDAAHGYKLYAMIRERRIRRRYLKDELRRANAVLDMSYTDIAGGGIESSFREIESQIYTPRVLTELFGDALLTDTKERRKL